MADVEDKTLGVQRFPDDIERVGKTSGSNGETEPDDVDVARVEKVYKLVN